jgi:hypothetical protein
MVKGMNFMIESRLGREQIMRSSLVTISWQNHYLANYSGEAYPNAATYVIAHI